MTRHVVAPAVALVLSSGLVAAWSSTPTFRVTDIGPGAAYGLNASGSVVGTKRAADGSDRAFLWTAATQREADLGIANSFATGINDDGVVVGQAYSGGQPHAFRWKNGVTTWLGALPGFTSSDARDVNATGQIVGASAVANYVTRGYLWDRGTMTDLGSLGGGSSDANAINDGGTVVGSSLLADGFTPHAFVWDATNGMQALGDLDGNNGSHATDVNDAGDVVGWSFTIQWVPGYYYPSYYYAVQGPGTATLWQDGVPVALGGANTHALRVNDATTDHGVQVVGEALDTSGNWVPYLWEMDFGGHVTARALAETLDAPFSGHLGTAAGIHDSGRIAFAGSTSASELRAFLVSPSALPPFVPPSPPAPSSISATAGAEHVSLSWSAVDLADTYVIRRGTASGGPYETIVWGLRLTAYVDRTAPLGATYHYVVAGVRETTEGGTTQGAPSADVAAAPLPHPPTGLTAKVGRVAHRRRAAFTWTASASSGVAHYKLYRQDPTGDVLVATLGTETSYKLHGLGRRRAYGFYVTAVHSSGQESVASNVAYVTTRRARARGAPRPR